MSEKTKVRISVDAAARQRALAEIKERDPKIYALYEDKLAPLECGLAKSAVVARYEQGAYIDKELSARAEDCEKAHEDLAVCLNVGVTEVYGRRRLAQLWTKKEIQQVASQVLATGEPLSYSALFHISKLDDEQQRRKLLARAQSECLSVREIRALIQELSGHGVDKGSTAAPRSPLAAMKVIAKQLESFVSVYREQTKVFDPLLEDDEKLDKKMLPHLQELLSTEQAIDKERKARIRKLEALVEHLARTDAASPGKRSSGKKSSGKKSPRPAPATKPQEREFEDAFDEDDSDDPGRGIKRATAEQKAKEKTPAEALSAVERMRQAVAAKLQRAGAGV